VGVLASPSGEVRSARWLAVLDAYVLLVAGPDPLADGRLGGPKVLAVEGDSDRRRISRPRFRERRELHGLTRLQEVGNRMEDQAVVPRLVGLHGLK